MLTSDRVTDKLALLKLIVEPIVMDIDRTLSAVLVVLDSCDALSTAVEFAKITKLIRSLEVFA